ncbi:hypothetical protein TPHA_0B00380 [Tetrapisispora phaffii CBS 4417]|uniref:C2H2-type domain-containing protein n=1 Tax=Tetrapisispora phaffii (strain ATCC 24235 / CBS 4417 / NBRC 1672 / NRRL Y-8282 / UCD 70-5) TaxID=1071381 RepID=G8BQB3_TETPH|nr:hypothetical protein TPHA_0B00380 [Tetrapisispora phaffii CBS 4417]CCE61710.1 hypothetical protein TPHA_0B00380 [Tetrapisispora phaffii CBS 4417]
MVDMLTTNKQSFMDAPIPIPIKSRPIKTDKPRPFLCSICTRGFVRQEHLKRHKISHTNEKPFLCIFCGRCFARKDLVLRHQYKLHPSLISKKEAINDTVSENEGTVNNTNIVKIAGNKKTILPTPLNPLGMTAAELKKQNKIDKRNHTMLKGSSKRIKDIKTDMIKRELDSSNADNNISILSDSSSEISNSVSPTYVSPTGNLKAPPEKFRKRHASFSASNVYTYRPDNLQVPFPEKDENEMAIDTPHQVGFSTPQVTPNRLLEKVFNSDYPENDPFQFSLDDPLLQNVYNEKFDGNPLIQGNHTNVNGSPLQGNTDGNAYLSSTQDDILSNPKLRNSDGVLNSSYIHSASFLSLANLLTNSSIGQGGYSNNSMIFNNVGINNHSTSMSNLFDYFSNPSELNLADKNNLTNNQSIKSLKNNNNLNDNQLKVEANNSKLPILNNRDNFDDKWLDDFLTGNSQFQNVDLDKFKLSSKHFNDIGFVSQNYSPSEDSQNNSNAVSPRVDPRHLSSETISLENTVSPLTDLGTANDSSLPSFVTDINKSNILTANNPNKLKYINNGRKNSVVTQFFNNRQHAVFNEDCHFMNDSLHSAEGANMFNSNLRTKQDPMNNTNNIKYPEFTEEIRTYIISSNSLSGELFPTVEELNSYTKLFIIKFHSLFQFIHIRSIEIKPDNYTFILSLTVIGALHSFHSTHAMLLSRICWTQIKNIINKLSQTHNYANTPLWVIQAMILLIFVNIFNNNLSVDQKKIIHAQISTLVELIKVTKINLPIESVEKPPIQSNHAMDYQDHPENLSKYLAQFNTSEQIDKDFQYFIKAQQRIRTCHVFLIVSIMFTNMAGIECYFHSTDVKCGIPCYLPEMFDCSDSVQWYEMLQKNKIRLDSKFALLELCNGGETYQNCLNYLANGNKFFYENEKLSFKTLLSLLIGIHEKIFLENNKLALQYDRNSLEGEIQWRSNSKPIIDFAMKNWEALYVKNGGVLATADAELIKSFTATNIEALLIIPMHLLACIRKCVNITPIMSTIYQQDWGKLNRILENKFFYCDLDSVHEATEYSLMAINFWIETVAVVDNAQKTSKRTPIFSVMSIFVSIFIIAEQMKRIEDWAFTITNEALTPNSLPSMLKPSDRMMWLKCEQILKKIELYQLPKGYNKETYSEFLRTQANGALDVDVLNDKLAIYAMESSTNIQETANVIKKASLSTRSLYLGVRILGDAPIWPIALLLAHALQSRAIYVRANYNIHNSYMNNISNQLFDSMNVETYYNSVLHSTDPGNEILKNSNTFNQLDNTTMNINNTNKGFQTDSDDDGILRF